MIERLGGIIDKENQNETFFMWTKQGLIYKPDGSQPFSRTHAQVPFGYPLADKLRVYFATRDENSSSSTSFVELDTNDLSKVTYVHDRPCLTKGAVGMFNETGAMPSWFLPVQSEDSGDEIWLYYTGWNKSETASYRLGIGLAISRDGGLNFERKYVGPLLDRSIYDPVWVAQPCVMREGDIGGMGGLFFPNRGMHGFCYFFFTSSASLLLRRARFEGSKPLESFTKHIAKALRFPRSFGSWRRHGPLATEQ